MRRKRKMNVVSVWIIVIFTVIAVTLVSLFLLVYSSIIRSELQGTLREHVEVMRDNADAQIIDVVQNQVARRLATKDISTGYIQSMANGYVPTVMDIRTLTDFFGQVLATVENCEKVELYFPSTGIVVGSHGVQYLHDRKYTKSNELVDYMGSLYPSDHVWLKRTVPDGSSQKNLFTYLRLYPGVFPAGKEPMLAVSVEETNLLSMIRACTRTVDKEDTIMLVAPDGVILSSETHDAAAAALVGTQLPDTDLSTDAVQFGDGFSALIVEAGSASGAWNYALVHPSSVRIGGYGALVSVWAILCVIMLFAGLAMVLQIMMKHYDTPMRRLVSSLPSNAPVPESRRTLSSPSEHFVQLESALSDMNKLREEREHFMKHNQPLLRQAWLNCFIQGEAYYSMPHPQLGLEFPYPHYQVVMTSAEPTEQEMACIRSAIEDASCIMERFESREKECVMLFNHDLKAGELPRLLEKAGEMLDEMQSSLVLGIGILAESDELVPASFRCARRSFASRYFEKDRRLCVFDPNGRYTEPENLLNEVISQLTELTSLIQRESQEKVEKAIDSIVDQLKETAPYMNTMRSVMLITAMRLAKVVYDMKGAPEEVYGDNLLNAYYHIDDISEFSTRLKQDCELLRRFLSRETSPGNRSVVQYAIHHIHNTEPAELSIHSIADAIGISTGHLSRMFHQETGRKLVDYLQEVRMEHAARLIAEGEMTNEEICGSIGYSRPQYFASKFKEFYGMTISEYRRKIQREQGLEENEEA